MKKTVDKVIKVGRYSDKAVSRNSVGSSLSQKDGAIARRYDSTGTREDINTERQERRKALTLKVFGNIYDDHHKARQ